MDNPARARVRRALLQRKKAPAVISTIEGVCKAGAQCPEVKAAPVAAAALTVLDANLVAARTSLSNRQATAQKLAIATRTCRADMAAMRAALVTYEASIDALARGDAVLIAKAGLLSRAAKVAPVPVERVVDLLSKPGKNPREATLSWPAAPGAGSYMVELNLTPEDPAGPWTTHSGGSRRRRTITGPTPHAQLLARVMAIAADGTPAAWSDPILITTR